MPYFGKVAMYRTGSNNGDRQKEKHEWRGIMESRKQYDKSDERCRNGKSRLAKCRGLASAAVFTNPDRGLPFPETSPSCVPYGHSMFEIVLDRRRRGWSTLGEAMMVPVVPSRRDGHLRS